MAKLRDAHARRWVVIPSPSVLSKAADMLEADARVHHGNDYTHPAPPAAEALAAQGVKLRTEFEPKPRDHVHVDERAGLIARLRTLGIAAGTPVLGRAAEMLEADGLAQQVAAPMTDDDIEKNVACI